MKWAQIKYYWAVWLIAFGNVEVMINDDNPYVPES